MSTQLKIHFLNVGHGDTTIIEFPSGRLTVIDINDSNVLDEDTAKALTGYEAYQYSTGVLRQATESFKKSYDIQIQDPVKYISSSFPYQSIFRFILTHPDMDHMSGFCRLQAAKNIMNFWDTEHKFGKSFKSYGEDQYDPNDWREYQNIHKENVSNMRVLKIRQGQTGEFWTEDGITILSPTIELEEIASNKEDPNTLSYVLLIEWGKSKIILGGDATQETWAHILDQYGEKFFAGINILKASHHGRESGYYKPVVAAMQPEYTIVSVGKKPDTDASSSYRYYSDNVWSTRWKGNIVATFDYDGLIDIVSEYER